MALNSDGLIDHLLFKAALSNKNGLAPDDFAAAVKDYHAESGSSSVATTEEDVDLFLSANPPAEALIINAQYLSTIWQWASERSDVTVTVSKDPRPESKPRANAVATPSNLPQSESDSTVRGDDVSCFLQDYAGFRLHVTPERIWYAITDHGVDWKRIPLLEWECLMVIAAAGPEGILQPDVTAYTGQDKRSVPKRTDALHQKGYIVKEACLGGGVKTSILRLKKFVKPDLPDTHFKVESVVGRGKGGDKSLKVEPLNMTRYDQWFDEIMKLLTKNNNIMAFLDLRTELGVLGKDLETRALHRCMRRLAASGLVRRLRARVDENNRPSSEVQGQEQEQDARFVRCIKLLREPLEHDRMAFTTGAKKYAPSLQGNGDSLTDDVLEGDGAEGDEFDDDVTMLDAVGDMSMLRPSPQWNPDLHYSQSLFNLIQSSGSEGISSMSLGELANGRFFKRPFDEAMSKLTDFWSASQPPHLRHLSIIRDTAVRGTVTHYIFRTFDNYQKAVDVGEASWEYAYGKQITPQILQSASELDHWGFPSLEPSLFMGKDGSSSVMQCARSRSNFKPLQGSRVQLAKLTTSKKPRVTKSPATGNMSGEEMLPENITPGRETGKSSLKTTVRSVGAVTKNEYGKRQAKESAAWTARCRKLAEIRVRDEIERERLDGATSSTGLEAVDKHDEMPAGARKRRRTLKNAFEPPILMDTPVEESPVSQRATEASNLQSTGTNTILPSEEPAKTIDRKVEYSEAGPLASIETLEPRAGTKRKRKGMGNPVASSMLPEDRVRRVQAEIMSKSEPGIYINPPGSVYLKLITIQAAGRPRNSLIAVCKSEKLRSLEWFIPDDNYIVSRNSEQPGPNQKRGDTAEIVTAAHGSESRAQDEQWRPSRQHGEQSRLASTNKDSDGASNRDLGSLAISGQDLHTGNPHGRSTEPIPATETISALPGDKETAAPSIARKVSPRMTDPVNNFEVVTRGKDASQNRDVTGVNSPSELLSIKAKSQSKSVTNVSHLKQLSKRSTYTKKSGLRLSEGFIPMRRSQIILDIVTQCGGMFPGDRELYYPFVTRWERYFKARPDSQTLDRIVKSLVSSNKLRKITFTFAAKSGLQITKHVLLEPQVDPLDPAVRTLQQKMIAAYPVRYIPDNVEVAPDLRAKIDNHPANNSIQRANDRSENVPHYQRDNFPADAAESVERSKTTIMLGGLEARLRADERSRKRHREAVALREKRYMDAIEEGEIDAAAQELQSAFQLHAYNHDPQLAKVDRGVSGRKRLSKVVRFGPAVDNRRNMVNVGSLDAMRKRRAAAAQNSAEGTATPYPALPGWYAPWHATISAQSLLAPQISGQTGSIITQWEHTSPGDLDAIYGQTEYLSLVDPRQEFSPHSGTFSTDATRMTSIYRPPTTVSKSAPTNENPISQEDFQIFAESQAMGRRLAPRVPVPAPSGYVTPYPLLTEQLQSDGMPMPKYGASRPRGIIRPLTGLSSGSRHGRLVPTRYKALAAGIQPLKQRPAVRPAPKVRESMMRRSRGVRSDNILPRATKTGMFTMDAAEDQRLVLAIAIVRTLTAGLEQKAHRSTNWGLVHQVFHFKFDQAYCRQRWGVIKAKHIGTIERMQQKFRRLFIDAYESEDLPEVDLAYPQNVDWAGLVDWTMERLYDDDPDLLELPADREAFDRAIEVKRPERVHDLDKTDFFGYTTTSTRRDEMATLFAHTTKLGSSKGNGSVRLDSLALAESWTRANVMTPAQFYRPDEAHEKLSLLSAREIDQAVDDLLGQRTIRAENKGRAVPGRNFDLADGVLPCFKRLWDNEMLHEAAAFKLELDAEMHGGGRVEITEHATNAQMLVMQNLTAHGRAKVVPLLPPVDHRFEAPWPKLTKWGFTEGNYKTVHMERARLQFGLELQSTEDYVYGNPLKMSPPPLERQFPGEIGARLAFWTDIHGALMPDIWTTVLGSLVNLLAIRPGLTAEGVVAAHKGKMWLWEVEMLLEWAEEAGLSRRLGYSPDDSWTTGEWWWMALGDA